MNRSFLLRYKTSRQVFASHTHISINLHESKGNGCEPKMAFPQIYFSIDDFEDAFEDLIVEEEDHCLCVLLYAKGKDEKSSLPPSLIHSLARVFPCCIHSFKGEYSKGALSTVLPVLGLSSVGRRIDSTAHRFFSLPVT